MRDNAGFSDRFKKRKGLSRMATLLAALAIAALCLFALMTILKQQENSVRKEALAQATAFHSAALGAREEFQQFPARWQSIRAPLLPDTSITYRSSANGKSFTATLRYKGYTITMDEYGLGDIDGP